MCRHSLFPVWRLLDFILVSRDRQTVSLCHMTVSLCHMASGSLNPPWNAQPASRQRCGPVFVLLVWGSLGQGRSQSLNLELSQKL